MKKGIFLPAILALGLGFTAISCSDDDDKKAPDNATETYSLDVTAILPDNVSASEIGDLTFTATHSQTEATYSIGVNPDSSLTATFDNLPSGPYVVKVEAEVSADSKLTGTSSIELYSDADITVDLYEVNASSLIFKEIYVSTLDYYFNDNYWEIVNNSDEVQYLDQCVMGHLIAASSQMTSIWVDEAGNSLEKYPMIDYVLGFPGNGTDYPLQPGESVVLAQDAVDHSEIKGDPAFPDLSNADWEAYLTSTSYNDVDYPAPNMEVIYDVSAAYRFAQGVYGQGLILAKMPEGVKAADFAADEANLMTLPGSTSTTPYLMIPSQYVLDAVQIVDEDDAAAGDITNRTILEKDDAGYTWTYGYSGLCIRRKAISIDDETGRVYYQDTNNSTDDFLVNQPLTPGVAPTSVD